MDTGDLIRELDKAIDVITIADKHFAAEAEMNAMLHMSDTIRPGPLASAVNLTLTNLIGLRDRLEEEGEAAFFLASAGFQVRDTPDYTRAAELYVESNIAQHGDVDLAQSEAVEWWDILQQAMLEAGR